jgi:putative transposase
MTEIPTGEGKRYLATVIDLYSCRLLACQTCEHPNAELARDAIEIAAATRGGREHIDGVIFHTDCGSTYTATSFAQLCRDEHGIRQSMGRVGSCFDIAAESFFSTLEHEVLPDTRSPPRPKPESSCSRGAMSYNTRRRHGNATLLAPVEFEKITADQPAAA